MESAEVPCIILHYILASTVRVSWSIRLEAHGLLDGI